LHLASNLGSKISFIVGWTAVVVLLDALLVLYAMSHGLDSGTNAMIGGVKFPLEWLPLLGVLIVSMAVWYDAFTRIFPRWLGPEADPLARLRFIRAGTVSLLAFVCLLYLPYLFGSNWFWLGLSEGSHVLGQLSGFGNWLETVEMPILTLNAIWQYSVTQILATAALIFFAWALARPAKRLRRIR
jgi:hypothetical protein